jgi:hypothetical protein
VTPNTGTRFRHARLGACLVLLACAASDSSGGLREVAVTYRDSGETGKVEIERGTLVSVNGVPGETRFQCASPSSGRVTLVIDGDSSEYGSRSTIVSLAGGRHPFTFFLRDVDRRYPILIPAYGAAVTEAVDPRTYAEIEADNRGRGLRSKLRQLEDEPEESFASAAASVRDMPCPTWLGLGRDIRIFSLGERLDSIEPRNHGVGVELPENKNRPVTYNLLMGRGWGVRDEISRRLEDGCLPILHGTLVDEGVSYSLTAFASLEASPLVAATVHGTPFEVADHFSLGEMTTPEQERRFTQAGAGQMSQAEETVLFMRAIAVNTSGSPRYAFFKNPYPLGLDAADWSLDARTGFARYGASGRVFAVSKLDGRPLAQEEVSVLLKPGASAVFDVFLPHQPIAPERGARLYGQDFEVRHGEARAYWLSKLDSAARIRLPEPRIEEMVKAGLLHLDLVAYGTEPGGTLAPTIGIYGPIGSESSPIIQFMDSMGLHDEARRCLEYFLDKQHESGFMQNFSGYMLETGAALWSMGEHYRYTRDDAWVRRIEPKLVKACQYIGEWRRRNLREDLRGKGYGMLEGKVADPEDPYRSFMLNGYHYLGMSRVAEMLALVDPPESAKWRKEAEALKGDIRLAAFEAMARSPVVPLGDGTWVPTLPPWVEARGALFLHAEGGNWFTHGSVATRDSLLGPLYLVFQEVIEPDEPMATFLLESNSELMTSRNVAFSQPYYSRHDWVHLRRGETKAFLKDYYNSVASLADRETYTFWEHFFHQSAHKTHEEAWFLMQTRWMLYMERGDTLELLPGVPRDYLRGGSTVELDRVASYFGPLTLRVESKDGSRRIEARIECASGHGPRIVEIRLPHPDGLSPRHVEGGVYDPATERVRIADFSGSATVVAEFN